MNSFLVDERLQKESVFLKDLKLSRVFLKKDAENPWLVLVPRRSNMIEFIDLSLEDQMQLMQEISVCSHALKDNFKLDKLNIGALGNIVSQLHIHIIARTHSDRAWPNPLWGTFPVQLWDDNIEQNGFQKIKTYLEKSLKI